MLAEKYDSVEQHGWYRNLDATVDELVTGCSDGDIVCDYSGGTGILADRLLARLGDRPVGVLILDSSPKFLRLALSKLGADPRVAFRLIRYRRDERRLDRIDEVVEAPLLTRGVDTVVSTNAIHLYYGLPDTLQSWAAFLRPGGRVLVQSGNIRNPAAPAGTWIIDETVDAIHRAALEIVAADPALARYRAVFADAPRMAAYDALREKYFLPVRPLDHYLDALRAAGFAVEQCNAAVIAARVDEWFEFLAAYHDGVLGWVGGTAKVDGSPPSAASIADRLALMRRAMDTVFGGRATFDACWTYLTCTRGEASLRD